MSAAWWMLTFRFGVWVMCLAADRLPPPIPDLPVWTVDDVLLCAECRRRRRTERKAGAPND